MHVSRPYVNGNPPSCAFAGQCTNKKKQIHTVYAVWKKTIGWVSKICMGVLPTHHPLSHRAFFPFPLSPSAFLPLEAFKSVPSIDRWS